MIRRLAAGTALVTGLTLSLTGCLGEAGDKVSRAGENLKLSAAQVVGKAAEKTGQADTFKADFQMNMPNTAGDVKASGEMQYQLKPELAWHMNFTEMSAAGQSMSGMQQILSGGTMYMKMPQLSQMPGASGKPWIKISLDELGRQSGMNIDQLLQQSKQMDPVQQTKMLTASDDVREVGKEDVNGVETTHYTGTYRLEDAIAQLPADQQAQARKSIAQSGQESMTFDLWVDDGQLPQKLTLSEPSSGMDITMTYSDYGKPVDISAPPAGQVTDFGAMMRQLQGS